MPNKKQKQAMRAEKKRRASAAKAAAQSAAEEFDEQRLDKMAREANLRDHPPVFEKLPVKMRKALTLSPKLKSKLRRGDVVGLN